MRFDHHPFGRIRHEHEIDYYLRRTLSTIAAIRITRSYETFGFINQIPECPSTCFRRANTILNLIDLTDKIMFERLSAYKSRTKIYPTILYIQQVESCS